MKSALFALALLGSAPAAAGDLPPELAALAAKDACTQLLLTYGEGLDEVDPAKVTGVFAADGVWTADGKVTANSRAELRAIWDRIAASPRPTVGVHAISNIRFEPVSDDELHGTALVVQHRYNPDKPEEITDLGGMMLVHLTMSCARTGEGWRFTRMELRSVSEAGYVHGEG